MKVWQKVFLCTFGLVIIGINIVTMVLVSNQHHLLIVQAKESAKSNHEYIITNIKNNIVYERTKQKTVIFNQQEVISLIEDMYKNGLDEDYSNDSATLTHLSMYQGTTQILNPSAMKDDLVERIHNGMKDSVYYIEIMKENRNTNMLVASLVTLEQNQYIVITDNNVTDIYNMYDQQVGLIKKVSIYSGFIIAMILLLLIRYLLSPLQEINAGTRKIAKGKYGTRVYVKGKDEFTELSQNMNRMAESIEKNMNSLEKVAENRKTFIDNLGHELKTPLTSILGFADILRIKREVTEEERQEYTRIIVAEANRMKILSGKLMELISLENTQLDLTPHSLKALLTEVVTVFTTIGNQNQIKIIEDIVDATVLMDKELFQSLLYNLLDNAMKASKLGDSIHVETAVLEDELCISIIDHGIGISKEAIDKITEPFYMVDKSRSRKSGGAGLGLALCNEIANVHNATLSFQSGLGKGTTVTIHMKGGTFHEII